MAKFSPFFVPIDGGIIHFVDEDDHIFDTGSLNQHGVFASLTSAFKAGFEFAFSGRNDLEKYNQNSTYNESVLRKVLIKIMKWTALNLSY